jgi:hypothetical protein
MKRASGAKNEQRKRRLRDGHGVVHLEHHSFVLEVHVMKLLKWLVRLLREHGGSGRGFDPDAGVRVPRTSPPYGRGAAVAVREPEPDILVNAVGRGRSASHHDM